MANGDPVKILENSICLCGCGLSQPKYDNRKRERKYIHGHNKSMLGKKYTRTTPVWNKGKTNCFSRETLLKMSKRVSWIKGKTHTPETRMKLHLSHIGIPTGRSPMKGKKHSIETRKKMSESHKGDKSYLWKGGITPLNLAIRASIEYKLWRESVFKRDNYTCTFCGDSKGGNLNADHIKPFAFYPELRFELSNGRTLCIECHKKTETFGNRKKLEIYV